MPGAIAVTQMFSGPSSRAQDSDALIRPALDAAYADPPAAPQMPATEAMLMMRPYFSRAMWRENTAVALKAPLRLTSNTRRASSPLFSAVQ